jgi:hypothetical protein
MKDFIEKNNIAIMGNQVKYVDIKDGLVKKKHFNLTLENVREQLSKINFISTYNKTGRVVNKIIEDYKMQPFAYTYYYLVVTKNKVPSPDELLNTYLETFCEHIENEKYTFKEKYLLSNNIIFEKNDLKARILRAYNSYNRELEFLIHLTTVLNNKALLKYELVIDICDGIDFIVKKDNIYYGIATYVNTKRANEYKFRKNNYRHDYSKLNMIDVVAILSGSNKNVINCGDVLIYNDKVIENIKNKILGGI